MIKLSKAGKMPCKSWSLQALDTCPGSIKQDGELVDACKGCYATTGNYNFPNVKAPRVHNREDWKRADWVQEMIKELKKQTHFRWFDSGDVYDHRLAKKMLKVMEETPWCKHWLPTRMHKFPKINIVLKEMDKLPNAAVRLSSDSINGELIQSKMPTSTIVPTAEDATSSMTVCKAYERDGKCADCRACWDKSVKTIAYVAHGRKINKVYKDKIKIMEIV
tara:strand:+ start:2450 stop:3109 length:660 start_codon:yes stop_codon:yes gene_type:complete